MGGVKPVVIAGLMTVAFLAQLPSTGASSPYEQRIWFTWSHKDLDVLVAHVHEPLIGASIQRAINVWNSGIAYWDPQLASQLTIRVYWEDSASVPPPGFAPDIVVAPQGFMAAESGGNVPCLVTAPMVAGWGTFDRVTYQEYAHCLGLAHVFYQGVEYKPSQDIMGDGDGHKCVSNINVQGLRNVFSGSLVTITIDPSQYRQAPC